MTLWQSFDIDLLKLPKPIHSIQFLFYFEPPEYFQKDLEAFCYTIWFSCLWSMPAHAEALNGCFTFFYTDTLTGQTIFTFVTLTYIR